MRRYFLFTLIFTGLLGAQRTIAILDFEAVNIRADEAFALTERFRSEIQQLDGRNIYLERNNIQEILQEQGFQQSGCISVECAVEIGNLLGAKNIITGSISRVGKTYSVNIRMIDIETGTISKTLSKDHQGIIDDLLTKEMYNLALEFLGIAPQITQYTDLSVALNSIRTMAKRDAREDMDNYYWAAGSGCTGGCSSCIGRLAFPLIIVAPVVGYYTPVMVPIIRLEQIGQFTPEVQKQYKKDYRKEVRRVRARQALIGSSAGLLLGWYIAVK